MNKIAVFLDSSGETTTFENTGHLKVFSKDKGSWSVIRDLILLPTNSVQIFEIRNKFSSIAKEISDCSVIVAKKLSGIAYNTLSSANIVVWECEGRPEYFLDDILEEEEEIKKEKESKKGIGSIIEEHVKKIEDGYYLISLDDIQTSNEKISSKQVLIPFLENKNLKKIDISCSHIPPWIEQKIMNYGFSMKVEDLCTNQIKIILTKE